MKLLALLFTITALTVFSAHAADKAPAEPKPDLAKGEALYGQVCAACHGADGNSNVVTQPKLAQQHPQYLIKELRDFKTGKRKNAIMQGFAASLSEDDMRNMSYWLASKKAKPGFAKDPLLVARGERLYRGGVAERGIPACAGCHSPNGAGIPALYPRLGGQFADYTASTLTEFREGIRTNSPQMAGVSERMNDHDIKAVADYIAGLR